MKKHLLYDYEEGDEIKVRYNGETNFHRIQTIDEDEAVFEDGTTFVVNKQSKNNGEVFPPEESSLTKSLASATVIPSLY